MNLTVIMPCAGKSTRFNSEKPKWMLTMPSGDIMLVESINGLKLKNISRIIITVVKDHIESSRINLNKLENIIFEKKGIRPEFLILDEFTSSQSETVYKTIIDKNITGPFFIKDCDNYFDVTYDNYNENFICISSLTSEINSVNKSYISLNKFGNVSGIVEKTIIGDKFCVGGYGFSDTSFFINTYNKVNKLKLIKGSEIYISNIIQDMLLDNAIFEPVYVDQYIDWGTWEDWTKYNNQFKTIFIDMDGVLVENGSELFEPKWGFSEGLEKNIQLVNSLYDSGKSTIIITTSRKEEYKEETLQQLKNLDIKYHKIIMGLPHAKRVLINDYSKSNPYPSAIAINLKRNGDDLNDFLK